MAGKMRMDQLVTGQMQIDEIVVHGAKLRMVRQIDGQWNAHGSAAAAALRHSRRKVKIEDASATIEDAATPASKPWAITGVNLQLTPVQSDSGRAKIPRNASRRRHHDRTCRQKRCKSKAKSAGPDGEFDLVMTADGLEISPEMLANLPGSTRQAARGRLFGPRRFGAEIDSIKRRRGRSAGRHRCKLDRGRIAHPLLPDAVDRCVASGPRRSAPAVRSSGLAASAARRSWWLRLSIELAGRTMHRWDCRPRSWGLTIDERSATDVPESYVRIWDRFKPAGIVDAEVRDDIRRREVAAGAIADCRGVSLTDAEKFPYPLEQTTGRVEYQRPRRAGPIGCGLDSDGNRRRPAD